MEETTLGQKKVRKSVEKFKKKVNDQNTVYEINECNQLKEIVFSLV